MKKPILDACCGSRMFWFDKNNPNVLFQDIRSESHVLCDGRSLEVKPDIISDFTNMDYPDETFYHIVFDPPHLENLGEKSYMGKKYGILPKDWRPTIKSGFDECMRVLKTHGTLILKWNESRIKVSDLIECIGEQPLYGHRTLQTSKTIWLAFMKLPSTEWNKPLTW